MGCQEELHPHPCGSSSGHWRQAWPCGSWGVLQNQRQSHWGVLPAELFLCGLTYRSQEGHQPPTIREPGSLCGSQTGHHWSSIQGGGQNKGVRRQWLDGQLCGCSGFTISTRKMPTAMPAKHIFQRSNQGNSNNWRSNALGSNTNKNKQICVFCKIPNHWQEDSRKHIAANKPYLDTSGWPFWPKVIVADSSNQQNAAAIQALQNFQFWAGWNPYVKLHLSCRK